MHRFRGMNRHFRIVAALDGSGSSEVVLEHALDQAARHETPELHIVAVADERYDAAQLQAWLSTVVVDALETFEWRRPDWETRTHVRDGIPEEEIANLAGELDADLIVIGRHNTQPHDTIADRVLGAAICPTLVIGLDAKNPAQCPVCVSIREESAGDCWYCTSHTRDPEIKLSLRVEPPPLS